MFKKRNLFSKLWLKHTNRSAYKQYKWELKTSKQDRFDIHYSGTKRLSTIPKILEAVELNGALNISHSGNAGDIIYALPTLKKIHELTSAPINFYLKLDQPMNMTGFASHPLGTVMLDKKMEAMLTPLLRAQPYIHYQGVLAGQPVHLDLDFFRSGAFSLEHSNIARWCSYITGASPELWKKWLFIEATPGFSEKVIVARSERYRNKCIDYSFLAKYKNLVFVGVKSEYDDIKKVLPSIEWVQVTDFAELAGMIAGCKLFIGNQSFPFSLAEALKVPRILEVYFHASNVIPEGENAHDFFFQGHFEWMVEHLIGSSALKS